MALALFRVIRVAYVIATRVLDLEVIIVIDWVSLNLRVVTRVFLCRWVLSRAGLCSCQALACLHNCECSHMHSIYVPRGFS